MSPGSNVPDRDYGRHGRCEATAKSTGDRCRRPAVGSHGKCGYHGGNSLRGRDHPDFKHGLFSKYLGEEGLEVVKELEEMSDSEKLDEIINWRLARLRRAVKHLNENSEEESFWTAFHAIVNEAGPVEAEEIGQLAEMLDRGNRALQDEINMIRKLIKTRNGIAEGQDVNLGWKALLADAEQQQEDSP